MAFFVGNALNNVGGRRRRGFGGRNNFHHRHHHHRHGFGYRDRTGEAFVEGALIAGAVAAGAAMYNDSNNQRPFRPGVAPIRQVQQQPQAPPGCKLMAVVCPAGARPGQITTINVEGIMMNVQVPNNVHPGMTFQFAVPMPPQQRVMPAPVMMQRAAPPQLLQQRQQGITLTPIPRSQWVHDNARHGCMLCNKSFGMLERKHHCRYCGFLLCANCSKHTVRQLRACRPCWLKEYPMANQTMTGNPHTISVSHAPNGVQYTQPPLRQVQQPAMIVQSALLPPNGENGYTMNNPPPPNNNGFAQAGGPVASAPPQGAGMGAGPKPSCPSPMALAEGVAPTRRLSDVSVSPMTVQKDGEGCNPPVVVAEAVPVFMNPSTPDPNVLTVQAVPAQRPNQ